jgi:hypothetical protein
MSLSPGQIAALRARLYRESRYYQRLVERMIARDFPPSDPLLLGAMRARDAVGELFRRVPIKPLRNGR